ncbi:5'-nucleotidase [Secundilactobacillus oryzae JCM 18671]|uniref:5'-nucleotidase n=1 Tax=Secundilactobacillus oryzae JCM 18671 TaxID=1291743 RepID=A0A081BIY7_9LACO|nr:bifunctional UDP-sugar hydrolase/5'-nucleotidase [Secundilactobacillus oryzae]GAK48005.1 5'-nucleotidase [Secundilactobacillus oryzae JCM 18671]
MSDNLKIFHTNDLHSHLENWPKIRRYINAQRAQFRAAGDSVFTFDIGDAMDRVHPLTEATDGKDNIKIMNEMAYDAVTIGNNEGIGNTFDQLNHLYDEANFDVVLGNLLVAESSTQPEWAKNGKILTTNGGTKVLVLGLTAPYADTYQRIGWQSIAVQTMLPKLLKRFEGQADFIVLLSHLGLNVDQMIAKQFPQVGLIIGAHTHHLLLDGQRIGQSLIAAAGKYGQYVGQISLSFNDEHQLIKDEATVVSVAGLVTKAEDKIESDHYKELGEQMLTAQPVARLAAPMEMNWTGYSRVASEGLAALEEAMGTNAAILNGGLFMINLNAGIVTRNDIHKLLPHSMHPMKVSLSGYDLWRLIQEMEKNRAFLLHYPVKGMGFRGKIFGTIDYSGISYDRESGRVQFRNLDLSPLQTYQIGMLDHYEYVPYFPTIEIMGQNEIDVNTVIRDVFATYLAKHYPL